PFPSTTLFRSRASLRPEEMRDCTLGILDEFDRRHAHARQEDSLRTSHEQTVCRMRAVLYEQLIAGDRDHHLPSRGELIRSRVLREDLWSHLHAADQVRPRALILAD